MDYNYRYKDKVLLDRQLQVFLADDILYRNVNFVTTAFSPLLRDYDKTDWKLFFRERVSVDSIRDKQYTLIFKVV